MVCWQVRLSLDSISTTKALRLIVVAFQPCICINLFCCAGERIILKCNWMSSSILGCSQFPSLNDFRPGLPSSVSANDANGDIICHDLSLKKEKLAIC